MNCPNCDIYIPNSAYSFCPWCGTLQKRDTDNCPSNCGFMTVTPAELGCFNAQHGMYDSDLDALNALNSAEFLIDVFRSLIHPSFALIYGEFVDPSADPLQENLISSLKSDHDLDARLVRVIDWTPLVLRGDRYHQTQAQIQHPDYIVVTFPRS